MTDVVFFAGPVQLGPEFAQIDWYGRDVRIIPIAGSGSQHFAQLGRSLRDGSGRIVPSLLARYAPGIQPDKIALAAFSAGHGLINEIGKNPEDRQAVDAVVLSDAVYIGHENARSGNLPEGLVNWTLDGAEGRLLSVATTSSTPGPTYLSASDSEALVWGRASALSGKEPRPEDPRSPAPPGRWQSLGKLAYWGDLPLSHVGHHDAAPAVWEAYLAPYLAGRLGLNPWLIAGAAALVGGALAYAVTRAMK